MKKLIITCALITSASIVSFAQTQTTTTTPAPTAAATAAANAQAAPHPQMTLEQMAERRSKMEEHALNLTPDQSKSVYGIELEWMQKVDALKKSGKASPDEFKALNEAKVEKMKKVLTPEQQTKYETMTNRQHPGPMTPASQPKPATTDAK